MRARPRVAGLVVAALALLLLSPPVADAVDCAMPRKPSGLARASVVRVVDGDTLVVHVADGRRVRVRMIGVDTPEVHPSEKLTRDAQRSGKDVAAIRALGARASEFTKKHLAGRQVELERDATALDRYGRTLAYVWVGEELYNVLIMREGYASPLTIPPNVKYAETLAACHRTAHQARRGLWAASE